MQADQVLRKEERGFLHLGAKLWPSQDCAQRAIRDPRVDVNANKEFLALMEEYFARSKEEKEVQARPELHYQVGVTPSGVEVPRCLVDTDMQEQIRRLPEGSRATQPTGPDLKWRYFWRVGERPAQSRFPELNAAPVIPPGLPHWSRVMDGWGCKLLEAASTVSHMAAVGFGLPPDAFTSRMAHGPHLLAPTGSDLSSHREPGTVFAGFHYDLNFLTLHGKSRYPGLFVWLRDGSRVAVRVPCGCLLLQAGRQLEWLTGGAVKAGMHEVVLTPEASATAAEGKCNGLSPWRVSSTVFVHIASDVVLQPLAHFLTEDSHLSYPAIAAGEQVSQELQAICLKKKTKADVHCEGSEAHPSDSACSETEHLPSESHESD
ncbi:MAG: hypothetical protein WDW36_003636 [Sanguina aurantia]